LGWTIADVGAAPPMSPQSASYLEFEGVIIDVDVVNYTHVEFMMVAEVANPSNQTIQYTVDLETPTIFTSPYGAGGPSSRPKMEIKAYSEKRGELDVSVDRWGNSRASSIIEAGGEDVIRVEGWIGLTEIRRMIWRESIDSQIRLTIDAETEEGEPEPLERTQTKVKLTYPAEYTKTDEANYELRQTDDSKVIEYTKELYYSLLLPLDMHKPRTPINSTALFSALWGTLIVSILRTRRKRPAQPNVPHRPDPKR
jgi:hypothetical protein